MFGRNTYHKKRTRVLHRVLLEFYCTQGFVIFPVAESVPLLVLPSVPLQIVQVIVVPDTFTYTWLPAWPYQVFAEELDVPKVTFTSVAALATMAILYTPLVTVADPNSKMIIGYEEPFIACTW
ncbi:MAG: hypothetical protein FD123_1929 [Bacteroidetes bacterium]|nr:MAG: hypothetical protein FD123_1929 [Bacteroidota bacterium]